LLAEFEDTALVKRPLDYDVSGKVRNQDVAIQLSIGPQIDAARHLTWIYIKADWQKVQAQLTAETGDYLVSSTRGFVLPMPATTCRASSLPTKFLPPILPSSTRSSASTGALSYAPYRSQT
jgi:hypothetical protein